MVEKRVVSKCIFGICPCSSRLSPLYFMADGVCSSFLTNPGGCAVSESMLWCWMSIITRYLRQTGKSVLLGINRLRLAYWTLQNSSVLLLVVPIGAGLALVGECPTHDSTSRRSRVIFFSSFFSGQIHHLYVCVPLFAVRIERCVLSMADYYGRKVRRVSERYVWVPTTHRPSAGFYIFSVCSALYVDFIVRDFAILRFRFVVTLRKASWWPSFWTQARDHESKISRE